MITPITKINLTSALNPRFLGTSLLLAGLIFPSVLSSSVQAVSLSNGRAAFDHAPRLVRASTNFQETRVSGTTHQFTIAVPEDAGESLKAVTISQPSNLERIDYEVNQSKAFAGDLFRKGSSDRIARGTEIPLASIGGPQSADGEVTIVFDRPVPPGKAVTVELTSQKNPDWDGVYLFGITAYPEGEKSPGLFLGYGRLNFHGPE
ncbi:DUF2808 domain-containing protein [Altericista sp. CCNU0014]|uniref:DUF2808 domain-containing protein n=1 Tax=Altericista sp. CCNU0014 TaxID=3082949 RepID=UPI00384F20D1